MEGSFKRRMRNAMKHLQEEEELSRLPKVTTSEAERRHTEPYASRHCQFSKHLEDIPTPGLREEEADRDLHFTKRCHQEEQLAIMQRRLWEQSRLIEALQTKIKCLQEELKAKDLDFIKTIISNLLLDREKLDHENKELVRICGHFEEELSRQQRVICDLLSDRDKLQRENKELVGINLQLQGQKQELCEYFDEQLSRERKLRKDCSRSLMDRDQLISLLCTREHKRCVVSVWQTKPEDKKEDLEEMKPQFLESTLKKDWLKASIDNLKTKKSEESRQNVLGWLQESLKNLNEVSNKASRPSLAEWLKGSLINLQKQSPETFREDVNSWLDVSLNQLQEEGPETSHLNVQEWLEASIQGIQDLQKSETEPRSSLRKEWLEKPIENLKRNSEGSVENTLKWLQESFKGLSSSTEPKPALKKWLQDSLKNLEEESSGVNNQDVKEWLQTTLNNLEEGGPEASPVGTQEWLEASIKSIKHLQKPRVTFRGNLRKEWLEKSIENLKKQSSEGPVDNILPWLQRSLERLSSSTEPQPVLEKWLQDSLTNLEDESSEVDNQDVKEWLQTTVNNLEEEGPEASPVGTQEWLEASIKGIKHLQKPRVTFRGSLRKEWLEKSIENLKKQSSEGPVDNILPWLQRSLERLSSSTEPQPVLEKWLQDSLKNLEEERSEVDNQDVKEWLQTTVNNLEEEGPEASHLGTQEWLEASIKGIQDLDEQYSKGRRASVEESREIIIQLEPAPSEKSLRNGWLQASLANSREIGSTASRTGLQGWLRASLGKLRREPPDTARNNLEEWLQEAIQNVQEGCPEESRQYVKEWLAIALNHLEEGVPETPHLTVEEWLKTSIQGLQDEIFKEMTGRKDPEVGRRKVPLSKGIPSQGKQIVRKNLGKESSWCRKRQGQILKTIGVIILLVVFLFAIYVHLRLYCVLSKWSLRPY
ncbi:thyroid receptor-interacting protein 11-like [Pantherophis guttatus]|uniref:Thyroid receptor-interacting protein 11-like n=1 Tax=Pantherophis guttatus TaxID=94885 RepID=A0A6P9APN5_PANGU|nr:thyroid receptor-interacting protein 11-like [Pantherophis guttatus]